MKQLMADLHAPDLAANRLSRRAMLRLMGASGGGLLLAACGVGAPAPGASPAASKLGFQIPTTGARLPTADVSLRWMDSGDVKAFFFKAFFPEYTKKHPNIKVEYDGTNWNEITQVVTLGFRNGTAPDVFQLPSGITAGRAVENRWIGPLDDIVPDWKEVKRRFPVGTFAPGVTDFGGKTYGYPFTSNQRIANLLLYNRDLLDEAGYDPAAKPLTWDQFRAACKKCTDQGAGKYYGLIVGASQRGIFPGYVNTLAEMAGAHGGEFNYQTGEYNYTSPVYIAAVELFLAIKSDGSFFPGTISLDAPGARARMPQGVSAMILQGPWNIPIWKKQNPSFHLGVALPPQNDPAHTWPLTHGPGGSNTWYYSATTQLGSVVGDIFAYIGSENGQVMWAHYDGAGDPAQFPDAAAAAQLDPLSNKAIGLAKQYTRLRPDPSVRNPDVYQVAQAMKPITPDFHDTLVGLFTGQLTGVARAMKDLQDRQNSAFDEAISVARSRGANVSRADYVFPDWDPSKDYTSLYEPYR